MIAWSGTKLSIDKAGKDVATTVCLLPTNCVGTGAAAYEAILSNLAAERRRYGESVVSPLKADPCMSGRFLFHVWLDEKYLRDRLTKVAADHGFMCCLFGEDAWYASLERVEPEVPRPPTSWWGSLGL